MLFSAAMGATMIGDLLLKIGVRIRLPRGACPSLLHGSGGIRRNLDTWDDPPP